MCAEESFLYCNKTIYSDRRRYKYHVRNVYCNIKNIERSSMFIYISFKRTAPLRRQFGETRTLPGRWYQIVASYAAMTVSV